MDWQHLRDETPVAAKPHECHLCGLEIAKGERHIKRAGIQDGELFSFRMHVPCESKTHDWDDCDWESLDPADFRYWELERADQT
jgi:hypothetical protein